MYSNFHRQQCASEPPRARQVALVHGNRRAGNPKAHSRGKDDRDPHGRGVFSKTELDACHVVDKEYSNKEYKQLTALQRQKLWLLQNGNKEPGTGLARQALVRLVAAASSSSSTTKKRVRSKEKSEISYNDGMDDAALQASSGKWGQNRDNPAVAGCQPSSLKSEKK